jgi:hypothetical protein
MNNLRTVKIALGLEPVNAREPGETGYSEPVLPLFQAPLKN